MVGLFVLAIIACLPVAGDRILVRDLAAAIPAFSSADPEEAIGFAPSPGAHRRFTAGELNRIAAKHGVTAELEPVCFERTLTALTREMIVAAMRESLPKEAELEVIEFSRIDIPQGALEFSKREFTGAMWRGRVRYAAGRSIPVWAKVRVSISRVGVVAARDLAPGKPIEAGDIHVEETRANPFDDSPAATVEQIAGRIPRRPIRAGETISLATLEIAVDVTRGETVGLEARAGAAFLKSEARAEASGRIGDFIMVRNIESGKTFRARVLRKGWVGVEQNQ
jgi:flagella basal body P-ring formation protein FlgA